jgi:hypothetical protein
MPKRALADYLLYDDDRFDDSGLVEPTSQAAMPGYNQHNNT